MENSPKTTSGFVGKWQALKAEGASTDVVVNLFKNKSLKITLVEYEDTLCAIWKEVEGGIEINLMGEITHVPFSNNQLLFEMSIVEPAKLEKVSDTPDGEDIELNADFFIGKWETMSEDNKTIFAIKNDGTFDFEIPAANEIIPGKWEVAEGGISLEIEGRIFVLPMNGQNIVFKEDNLQKIN